jgi:hypothetical protein
MPPVFVVVTEPAFHELVMAKDPEKVTVQPAAPLTSRAEVLETVVVMEAERPVGQLGG